LLKQTVSLDFQNSRFARLNTVAKSSSLHICLSSLAKQVQSLLPASFPSYTNNLTAIVSLTAIKAYRHCNVHPACSVRTSINHSFKFAVLAHTGWSSCIKTVCDTCVFPRTTNPQPQKGSYFTYTSSVCPHFPFPSH
jgi:hypothetical protein